MTICILPERSVLDVEDRLVFVFVFQYLYFSNCISPERSILDVEDRLGQNPLCPVLHIQHTGHLKENHHHHHNNHHHHHHQIHCDRMMCGNVVKKCQVFVKGHVPDCRRKAVHHGLHHCHIHKIYHHHQTHHIKEHWSSNCLS